MINRLPKSFWLPKANGAAQTREADAVTPNIVERAVQAGARYIGDHPVAALGAAFVVGLLIGRVVKR